VNWDRGDEEEGEVIFVCTIAINIVLIILNVHLYRHRRINRWAGAAD